MTLTRESSGPGRGGPENDPISSSIEAPAFRLNENECPHCGRQIHHIAIVSNGLVYIHHREHGQQNPCVLVARSSL